MSEWKKVKLGDLCDFINGGAWSDKEYVSEGIPVLKVTNCKNSGFSLSELSYLPFSLKQKYSQNELRLHDVIIATVGSHPNLVNSSAGRSVIVNSFVAGFYLNQNAVCIRTKDSKILNQLFFGYYSKYYLFQHYIQMRGKGAANQMRIAISAIKDYPMPLPSIEHQSYIASILSNYDSLIENYQRQIKLLEEAAQRLYKEWFVDLNFPGHESTNFFDGVPEGWEKKKISDVCETIGGGTPSTKVSSYYDGGSISWVTPTDITKNNSLCLLDTEKKITKEGLNHSSAKMLPAEAILMTSRASVGYFGICDFEVCTNQGFISCVPFEKNFQMYLLYNLINRVDEIRIKAGGSTYLEISKSVFRNFEIICPSNNLVTGFQQVTHRLLERTRIIAKQIRLLTEASDRLLPKLMNGEISVETAQSVTSGLGVRKEQTNSPQATDS